jgi:hypothetical protein
MPFIFKRLALFMSIAGAFAADKQPPPFRPPAAATFAHHEANSQVTVGVDPYDSGEKIRAAFGKLDPYQLGVLPVLIAIENGGAKSISLDRLRAEYVGPDRRRVEATPAGDLRYIRGPDRPRSISGPGGTRPIVLKSKKNPFDAWEIEGRAFVAKMLPPGQTASGFFYFQTGLERGATIYLNGLAEADTNKELLYFEIPLGSAGR